MKTTRTIQNVLRDCPDSVDEHTVRDMAQGSICALEVLIEEGIAPSNFGPLSADRAEELFSAIQRVRDAILRRVTPHDGPDLLDAVRDLARALPGDDDLLVSLVPCIYVLVVIELRGDARMEDVLTALREHYRMVDALLRNDHRIAGEALRQSIAIDEIDLPQSHEWEPPPEAWAWDEACALIESPAGGEDGGWRLIGR